MRFQFNDGGRSAAGYEGKTGDCATRAIAIVTGLPYQKIYDEVNKLCAEQKIGKRMRSKGSARTGVYHMTGLKRYLDSLGLKWTATMGIGSGCKVHLKDGELPMGRLLARVSKHYVAVIDGVINDTHDCSRQGMRCVYGYYSL